MSTQDPLKLQFIIDFVLTPWVSWPFQAFPANRFAGWSNERILRARNSWGFFERVESLDAAKRLVLATQSVIGTAFVTDPNLWYELDIESEYDDYKYGQYLHDYVIPEISWNSQRHLGIPLPGARLSLQLLTPYPTSVTNVLAFPGNRTALIAWPESTEPVISYTITSNPGNFTQIAEPGALSLRISDLSNGTPYTFTVTVTNSLGLTSTSLPSAPVIPRTNPDPPTDISATPGLLSASVSWIAPVENGGGPIASYTIVSNPGNVVVDVSGQTAIVPGLLEGATYRFTVIATNIFGLSSITATSNLVTILSRPGPPTDISATPDILSASLSWNAPSYTGGRPITNYTIVSNPGNITVDVSGQTAIVPGLQDGVTYRFTVIATNSVGLSSITATSNLVTILSRPDPPTGVTANPGFLSASLSWVAPVTTGGKPITNYTIVSNPGNVVVDVSGLTAIVTGLDEGGTYSFTVLATNSVGLSSITATSNTVILHSRPDPPIDLSASPGPTSIVVRWLPAPLTGGVPVTSYTVMLEPSGPIKTVTVPSAIFTGLTIGTSYTASVTTNNIYGSSAKAYSPSIPPLPLPDPPVSVNASYQNTIIVASWPASNPRGTPILSYTATLLDPSSNIVETKTVSSLTTFFSIFEFGTLYRVSVSATNASGTSPVTISGSIKPFTVPGIPLGLMIQVSDSSARLMWSAPYDGGSAITGYRIFVRPGLPLQAQNVTDLSATFTGLINGTTYEFSVVAVNTAGLSAPASILGTPVTNPSVPIGVQADSTSSTATISWFPPAYTGGSPLTLYTVSGQDSSGNQLATVSVPIYSPLTVTYTGLTNGTTYIFTVTVFTQKGSSNVSVTIAPISIPDPPIDLSGVNVGNAISLTWNPPRNDGGSPILDYMVSISPGCGNVYTQGLTTSFQDLIPGTIYTMLVSANNVIGPSVPAKLTMMHITVPTIPLSISLVMGAKVATLTWRPPASTGGIPLTSYTVNVVDPSGSLVTSNSDLLTSTNFAGLLDNTVYSFTLFCSNSFGSSPTQVVDGITASLPSVARSLTAVAGLSRVDLSWQAPAFNGRTPILSYTIDTYDSSNNVVNSATASSLSYGVTGLDNGSLYTFTVTAVNAIGSGPSVSIQAMPVGIPGPPQSLSIVESKGSLVLAWLPPLTNGGIAITGYTLTTNAAPVRTVTDLSASYTGLTNGTTYSFSVTASNGRLSSQAATITGIPGLIPSIPLNLATTSAYGTIGLSWSRPSDNGGLTITSYTITAVDSLGTSVVIPSIAISSVGGSTSFTGLTNGVSYTFTVAATNSKGTGPTATISDTPGAAPSIPRLLTVAPTSSAILLSWSPPTDNGGFPVTSYIVSYDGGSQIPGIPVTSYSFTGLTNGRTYTFYVSATNSRGSSSTAAINSIPIGAPSAPLNLAAVSSSGTLSLSWSAPDDTGGFPVIGYTMTVIDSGGTTISNPAITNTGSGGSAILSGLTNGEQYTISVAAQTSQLVGTPAIITGVPGSAPSVPTGLTVVPSDGSLYISWSPPVSTGGFPIIRYTGTFSGVSLTFFTPLEYTYTGLINGTTYAFSVNAENTVGISPEATITGTPLGSPSIPRNLTASPSDSSLSLSWLAPANTGGSPITGYEVIVTNTSTGAIVPNPQINNSGSGGSVSYTGLSNGVPYTVSVAAIGASTGTPSTLTSTPRTIPGPPTSLVATSPLPGSVSISWSPPLNNGGVAIREYIIRIKGEVGVSVVGPPYVFTGLSNGISYMFIIYAIGSEAGSEASITFAPLGPPNDPTNVVATPSNGSVILTWNNPATNAGTSYFVEYTGITRIPVNSLTYSFTGLTNGVLYVFRVTASNSYGTSNGVTVNATPISPSTIPDRPGVFTNPLFGSTSGGNSPGNLYVAASSNAGLESINTGINADYSNYIAGQTSGLGALIVWYAATNGGSPIDYYRVTLSSFGSTLSTYTVTGLLTETAGVTKYAFWAQNLPSWTVINIDVSAHNTNGFGAALTGTFYFQIFFGQ